MNNEATIISNLGEFYRQNDQLKLSLETNADAVRAFPEESDCWTNLGLSYYSTGDSPMAIATLKHALSLDKTSYHALNAIGAVYEKEKMFLDAFNAFNFALEQRPKDKVALNNVISTLINAENSHLTAPYIARLLEADEGNAEAWYNIGTVAKLEKRDEDAIKAFERSITLDPNHLASTMALSEVHNSLLHTEESYIYAKRAYEINPDSIEVKVHLGRIIVHWQGESEEAAHMYYDEALEMDPTYTVALAAKGKLHVMQGDMDLAWKSFEKGIGEEGRNSEGKLHSNCICEMIQHFKVKDGSKIQKLLEVALTEMESFTELERIAVLFAGGKMYDDLGQYTKSLGYWMEANALRRSTFHYKDLRLREESLDISERQNTNYLKGLEKYSVDSDKPIFVCGMPRSGTTLVEQIISSVPGVHGAGEIGYLDDLLHDGDVKTAAEDYLEKLRMHSDDPHIVNKLPSNFKLIGAIRALFPNAKIVYVKRSPMDNAISLFSRNFRNVKWSYNMGDIRDVYQDHLKIMDYWRAALPADAFYEVNYEDLIADPEMEIRALISGIGLPWHDDCLNHQKNARSVRTSSLVQVRQPIYSTSINRWKRYEPLDIEPLLYLIGEQNSV